ncbi:MAG: endonuclease [Bacteroidetes bacterium]|nr:endonuclease [Bacteroidota bacterium]
MGTRKNRYSQLIEAIFNQYYENGKEAIQFERTDLVTQAKALNIKLPKNLGDVLYSFRYRTKLPESITSKASEGYEWVIRPAGRARYQLSLVKKSRIIPSEIMAETKIPDATPGVITKYSSNDEQALLAKIRYNRLVDIFTRLTCYSLQNHYRTTVSGMGQVETDEIYIGIDKRGAHYVLPVQAKGKIDQIGIVQIEQDIAICEEKFPNLISRSIAAQLMDDNLIALFELEKDEKENIRVGSEKHYKLVHPDELSLEELERYKIRT